jgi:hypothetical protein
MILGYQRYIFDAEVTETKDAQLLTSRLGYLTSAQALAACAYLANIGKAQKSKVETGHRQSETERAAARVSARGITAFTCGAAILSIVMLPIFFRGKSADAAKPQAVADSSAHGSTAVDPLHTNKLNPPPSDILAVQNRLIELGFLNGPADGVWGPKSRMALRAFKTANGLTGDDKWDDLASGRLYSTQAARSSLPLATTSRAIAPAASPR